MSFLANDVRLLAQIVEDLETALVTTDEDDVAVLGALHLAVEDAARVLNGEIRPRLAARVGDAMGEHRVTIDGLGTFTRHQHKSRTQWDKDALLCAVLDSRLVDTETGEVTDETPLDRVLSVWNLGAPRTSVLKTRGIDADEFCHVEKRPGWAIEVARVASGGPTAPDARSASGGSPEGRAPLAPGAGRPQEVTS